MSDVRRKMDNGEEFKGQDQQEGQDQNDEFNGYD